MAIFAIGDIQGCYSELRKLLDTLRFTPDKDQLWLTGDLVNRGPESLATLRFVRSLGAACITVLGNHDLHLLALRFANKTPAIKHNLDRVLQAPDAEELLDWLRRQPLAHYDAGLNTLLVHAGIAPAWDGPKTLQLAAEVETLLRGDSPGELLELMYGRKPALWSDSLMGADRIRCITNHLTRLRLVTSTGAMDFTYKGPLSDAPTELMPWFEHPKRRSGTLRIVFGHWSALGFLQQQLLLGLDTGCVWGDSLTALRIDTPDAQAVQLPSLQTKRR